MADRYASLKQGLVGAWIPSISGSGLLLPDLSGRGNNGSLVGMDASDWVSSQYGRALDFDYVAGATRQAVELSNNVSVRGLATASISLWCNLQAAPASNAGLYYEATASGGFTKFGIYQTNANALLFVARDTSSGSSFLVSHAPSSGVWLHVAGTYNAHTDLLEMFVNGVSVGRDTTAKGILVNDAPESPIAIGAFTYVGASNVQYSCNAQLDDIRIYNRALTESEIRLLSSEPGIGFKRISSSAFATRYAYKPAKPRNYSVVRVKETDYATLRQGLVGAWCPSLPHGGSGNTLPDVSGYGNHGSLVNMSPDDWVSSQYGRALDFDGSNDYVLIGSPASIAVAYPQFTKSLWVLLRNTSLKYLFADFNNAGTTSRLSIAHDTRFFAFQNTATVVTSATTITTGVWYHVAVTRDDGTGSSNTGVAKIYINGNLEASSAYSYNSPALQISGEQLARSNALYGDHPDCQIDDARIYNRALSEPEIRLLASRPGIGLRQESHRQTFYQFPSGARRRRILTGMP